MSDVDPPGSSPCATATRFPLLSYSSSSLFERYAAAARATGESRSGCITILVSHRFSTVRMADLIVVLDGARLVEVGTHDALIAKGGQYAELYGIQAATYR